MLTSREIRSRFVEFSSRKGNPCAFRLPRARQRPDAALHHRRDGPVQGRIPRGEQAALQAGHDCAALLCAPGASTTIWRSRLQACAIIPSSKCWATSASATISSARLIAFAWKLFTEVWRNARQTGSGRPSTEMTTKRRAVDRSGRGARLEGDTARREGQLVGDGRHRPLRALQRIFWDYHPERTGQPGHNPEATKRASSKLWNLVFMQFDQAGGGVLDPLPTPVGGHRRRPGAGHRRSSRARTATTTPTSSCR